MFLELFYFASDQLPWHFPGIEDPDRVAHLLALDIDHQALHAATRLPGAEGAGRGPGGNRPRGRRKRTGGHGGERSAAAFAARVLAAAGPAERAGTGGTTSRRRSCAAEPRGWPCPDRVPETMRRLRGANWNVWPAGCRRALDLTEEETGPGRRRRRRCWTRRIRGSAGEVALLYDLQKVCVEHERGLFTLDLLGWFRTLGRVPLRRPLPLLSGRSWSPSTCAARPGSCMRRG